jgi:hypothetical protein
MDRNLVKRLGSSPSCPPERSPPAGLSKTRYWLGGRFALPNYASTHVVEEQASHQPEKFFENRTSKSFCFDRQTPATPCTAGGLFYIQSHPILAGALYP